MTQREIDPDLCDIDFDELHLDKVPFSDGAYSKVYKATYQDMLICAKLIPKDMDKDDELFHLYVEREMQVSKELDHPNVVKHYGSGQDEQYYYLLTEYVPGGNMRSFIKHHRGLAWDLKVHIAIGIAQGLQYMHSKNILHRDIKSENFLVGDNWQIKICDFGFAKIINGDITKRAAHSICGTEEYMAPEMLMGLDYNDKVDVFSYGIFLAELLTQCYLPTDLVRTPATQFGLNGLAFKELLPPDCPLPLAELVIDCCHYVTTNRPSLERIIHKLHDIKEVLPLFNVGNPNPQDPHVPLRRKSSRNIPEFKQEEIKISHFYVDEAEEEEEGGQQVSEKIVYEEITLDDDVEDDDVISDDESHEVELRVHEMKEDEVDEDELLYDELQEDQLQEHELQEDELQEDELQEQELLEEEGGEWPQSYEVITKTTKAAKEVEEEEEEEEIEMQFEEFQVKVVDYGALAGKGKPAHVETTPTEKGKPAHVEEKSPKPTRPKLQQRGGGATSHKPVLQHWESRELLENTVEREFRLAREFVRERELPALSSVPKSPTPSDPPAEPPTEPPAESGIDLDADPDLEMEELKMESFIVFEYPEGVEERGEESNFNFSETFTSKSNKYSVYYH